MEQTGESGPRGSTEVSNQDNSHTHETRVNVSSLAGGGTRMLGCGVELREVSDYEPILICDIFFCQRGSSSSSLYLQTS